MALFTKSKKNAGWMAIFFQDDGICVAHIKRSSSAMPLVDLVAFFPAEQSSQANALEKLAKELRANNYACMTLLAFDEYQLLSVDALNVPQEELKAAIRWRLKDMLDFHVDDATVDVLHIPTDKSPSVRSPSMYAVAARNQLIEQRQGLFSQAKIPLSVIDIPEMAQRNISVLLEPEGRGLALLSFDSHGGLLTVTFSGELYLARRMDVTLEQLTQTDADQKNALFDRVTLELQRSFDHFDRQYHFIAIAKLVLAPMSIEPLDMRDYFAANLYMPVEVLNLETVLDISKAPELKSLDVQQRSFLVLGAALRHEEKAL